MGPFGPGGQWTLYLDTEHAIASLTAIAVGLQPTWMAVFLEDKIASYLRARAELRFQGEGDDASGAWPPLTWPTENIREDAGFPRAHPINVRTGELHSYVVTSPGLVAQRGDGADLVWPAPLPTGDLESKFKVAQQGAKPGDNPDYPDRATPPRRVVDHSEVDLAAMLILLEKRVETILAGIGPPRSIV